MHEKTPLQQVREDGISSFSELNQESEGIPLPQGVVSLLYEGEVFARWLNPLYPLEEEDE